MHDRITCHRIIISSILSPGKNYYIYIYNLGDPNQHWIEGLKLKFNRTITNLNPPKTLIHQKYLIGLEHQIGEISFNLFCKD